MDAIKMEELFSTFTRLSWTEWLGIAVCSVRAPLRPRLTRGLLISP
jgi:hypothetical protein